MFSFSFSFSFSLSVISTFFILCRLTPSPTHRTWTSLSEGLFQVYLNLVADTTEIKAYHRPAVSRFIADIREAIPGLPDFSDIGLNSAWSMMQGESQRLWSIREKDGCKNEACMAPETENGIFYGHGEQRRCNACYKHAFRNGGQDRTAELVQASADRAAAQGQGCKNRFCNEPFEAGNVLVGVGEARRCNTCQVYRRTHGVDRPKQLVDQARARRESRQEGCKNRECRKPFAEEKNIQRGRRGAAL
jgi:hypothetical protein